LVFALNSSVAMRFLYPFPYREEIMTASGQHQVDPHLVMAIIYSESHFEETAASKAGALGLMQIMPKTGEWIAARLGYQEVFTGDMLLRADVNLRMGIWYLAYLERIFGGSMAQVLAAYNAGEGTVRQWLARGVWSGYASDIGQIPYKETRRYVSKVMDHYELYRRLYQEPTRQMASLRLNASPDRTSSLSFTEV
jgi:soluble lytic murein transglycosylase